MAQCPQLVQTVQVALEEPRSRAGRGRSLAVRRQWFGSEGRGRQREFILARGPKPNILH